MSDADRWQNLRRLLDDDQLPTDVRAAGTLVPLLARLIGTCPTCQTRFPQQKRRPNRKS